MSGYTHYKIKLLRNSTTVVFITEKMQRQAARQVFFLLQHKFSTVDGYAISVLGMTEQRAATINNDDLTRGDQ